MELSGLIFVALALVWAVVLIPKALRHHDVVAMTRAVDDVSDGVRVVVRRSATTPVAPAPELATSTPTAKSTTTPPTSRRRSAAQVAARRRRRILGLLLLATVGVGVAAALRVLLPWAPAIPAGLTVAFLVVARLSVRRQRARRSRRAAARAEVLAPVPAQDVLPGRDEPQPALLDTEPVVEPVLAELHPFAAPRLVSGLDDTSAIAIVSPAELEGPDDLTWTQPAPGGSVWDPLPVTLPTYVTKARASRSVRTIDLGAPGVSSSGHDAAASALVAEAATAASSSAGPEESSRAVGS